MEVTPAHVSGGCEDARVVQEPTGREVPSVSLELLADPHVALPGLEAVDGADVVQPSAGHETARWSVGTCHDPAGAQRNGVDLGRKRERERERESLVASVKKLDTPPKTGMFTIQLISSPHSSCSISPHIPDNHPLPSECGSNTSLQIESTTPHKYQQHNKTVTAATAASARCITHIMSVIICYLLHTSNTYTDLQVEEY